MRIIATLVLCMFIIPALVVFAQGPLKIDRTLSAYHFGAECRKSGVPAEANPYIGDLEKAESWLKGWMKK